jgi:Gpi18-like mannosyltransferase
MYILNKLYIIFLIYLTRDYLGPILPATLEGLHPHVIFDSLIHYDAGWYLRIAGQGYDFNSAPFFPLLPIMIRLLTYLTQDAVAAGFLISNAALFIACYYLHRLVKEEYDLEIASAAVFIMLFFPTAIFYSTIYTEAPFLAFTLAAFYYGRQKRWILAAILGACAALTRNIGVVLFLAFLYMQYQQEGYRLNIRKALPLALIPASLLVFLFILGQATGDPLAFSHSLQTPYWGNRHFAYPGAGQLRNLASFIYNNNSYSLFESGMALLFLYLVIRSFKYIKDRSMLIFLVLGFLIPFSSVVGDMPLGMPRYILVLFPGFITLAILLRKHNLYHPYTIITTIAFSVICAMFVAGRWIS